MMDRTVRKGGAVQALAVLSALLLVLGGCGEWEGTGEVVDRQYDDPDTYYIPGYTIDGGQTCSGGYNDVPRVCTNNPDIHIPGRWATDPASWYLTLLDEDGDTHKVTVSEWTYHNCPDGYNYTTETDLCEKAGRR